MRSSNQRTATRIDRRVDNSTPAGATIERAEFAGEDWDGSTLVTKVKVEVGFELGVEGVEVTPDVNLALAALEEDLNAL